MSAFEPHEDQPTNTWPCHDCNQTVERYRGQGDVQCARCGAWYNASGQRLRDDWQNNPAWGNQEIDDMTGYELQQLTDEEH